jgi:hypothetical protein
MRNLPNQFEYDGLLCYRGRSDPFTGVFTYYYLPLRADVDRSDSGRPMVNLFGMGTTGYLMITAVWSAPDRAVEGLRLEILRRAQIEDPATIYLVLAPVQVTVCNLLMGDGSELYQRIASSSTSGMPPFSALFNTALNEEQFHAAAAALNGNPKRLVIEYEASLITPLPASARLIPLSFRFVSWLQEHLDSGPDGFRAAVQEAIEEGLASVQLDMPENAPDELISRLYDLVLTNAVEFLPRMLKADNITTITDVGIEVSVVEEMRQSLLPSVDLAS